MTRTPAAILILAFLIANGVSAAPREDRKPEESSKQEEFLQSREDEVSEQHSIRGNGNPRETREEEMKNRHARLASPKEPLPSPAEMASINKSATIGETDEAKDMTKTTAFSKVLPNDSTESNKTSPIAPDNDKKPVGVENSEKKNVTSNATHNIINNESPDNKFPEKQNSTDSDNKNRQTDEKKEKHNSPSNKSDADLPPKESPENADKTSKNSTDEFRNKNRYETDVKSPDASTNNTTNSTEIPLDILEMTQPSVIPSVLTTESSVAVVTTETPKETTTQELVSTHEPITTENSEKEDKVTESTTKTPSIGPSEAELQLHEKKTTPMPTGIVTLITVIAFAIVAITAYVSLVAWRRYLEWRYGNRELLVNEFDPSDIGNFEL